MTCEKCENHLSAPENENLNGEDNDQASLKTGYAAQLGESNDQPFDGMECPIRQTNIEEQTLLPLRT